MGESNDEKTCSNNKKWAVSVNILDGFCSHIEALRKTSAPSNDTVLTDHIDQHAKHLVLYHDLLMVGAVRISSSMNSILNQWYEQYPFPSNSKTAELTKAYILPVYQNKGLYKLIMLETLLRLPELGYTQAIAAVRPNFLLRSFLKSLGFVEHECSLKIQDQNANFEAIPIYLKNIDQTLIKEKYFLHIETLIQSDLAIKSNLLIQ